MDSTSPRRAQMVRSGMKGSGWALGVSTAGSCGTGLFVSGACVRIGKEGGCKGERVDSVLVLADREHKEEERGGAGEGKGRREKIPLNCCMYYSL